MSSQRKPAARLARPAQRYWKGKAPKGSQAKGSSSDSEAEENEEQLEEDMPLGGLDEDEDDTGGRTIEKKARVAMNVALKDVNVDEGGKVIVGGKEESGRTAMEDSEEESSEDDEEPVQKKDEESGSSEAESSSDEEEEEEKTKVMFRPVFVPKRGRVTVLERENDNPESEDAIAKREQELEQRKKESHDLVAESIKRELAEKETADVIPDVDDADGLDPEAEFEAWRIRELSRIKRDKEAVVRREEEREELEKRRAMPEEQRLKEDLEHANKTRDDKPKGQQKFLQKYWHKGAFHQDDEILKKHDYTQATSSTVDISLLPKVMQVKDFGKRSRTKYTHLREEDTTQADGSGKGGNVVCFLCGGPHLKRECPQNPMNGGDGGPNMPSTGSNNASGPSGPRKWGLGSRQALDDQQKPKPSWRDRDDGYPNGRDRGSANERRRDWDGPGGRDNSGGARVADSDRRRSRSNSPSRREPLSARDKGPRRWRHGDGDDDSRRRRRSRSRSRERESGWAGSEKRRRYD